MPSKNESIPNMKQNKKQLNKLLQNNKEWLEQAPGSSAASWLIFARRSLPCSVRCSTYSISHQGDSASFKFVNDKFQWWNEDIFSVKVTL